MLAGILIRKTQIALTEREYDVLRTERFYFYKTQIMQLVALFHTFRKVKPGEVFEGKHGEWRNPVFKVVATRRKILQNVIREQRCKRHEYRNNTHHRPEG